jgi:hypothetical protein
LAQARARIAELERKVGQQALAKLSERRIQHRPDMIGIRARQRLTAQQIAAVGIGDRQRFAAPARRRSGTNP